MNTNSADYTRDYLLTCAKRLIRDNLGVHVQREELLIIADEVGLPVAEYVVEAADQLGIGHLITYVPTATQRRFADGLDLSLTLEGAINNADAVLNCVTDRADCTRFRRAIINQLTPRKRIGHMPGASLDVLALAGGDLPALVKRCQELAQSLAQGQRLELCTFDSRDNAYQLTLDLGCWERMPVISDGKIEMGAWGNVPSGETCIAPLEGTANGQVVINGAVPSHVITPGEEIVIGFEAGRAVSFKASDETALDILRRTQLDWAREQGDENWNHLGEVGIGVNSGVGRLTGVELIDEKKAGTAHIALGDSIPFGGLVSSLIHCDLIIDAPTLLIDDLVILERGQWRLNVSDWCIEYDQIGVPEDWESLIRGASLTDLPVEVHEGELRRLWQAGSGRSDYYPVGCSKTARLAAQVYYILNNHGAAMSISQLLASWGPQASNLLCQVLKVMEQHKVVLLD